MHTTPQSHTIFIRKAKESDRPFIANAIIEAEKSGTQTLFYTKVFQLYEVAVIALINDVFEEEIEGQEWCLSQFYVLEIDGQLAACLSSWIEGESGVGSGMIKAQILSYVLGDKWERANAPLALAASIQIPRIQGALQLECIFTAVEFRGKGLMGKLIQQVIEIEKNNHPALKTIEIQLMGNNANALASYTKCGFLKRSENTTADLGILNLLPGDTRVSLVKEI
jgi:GNAT superfamily N-acetyltransferase